MAGRHADEAGGIELIDQRAAAVEAQEGARRGGDGGGQPDRRVGVGQRQQQRGQRGREALGHAAGGGQRLQPARMGEGFQRGAEHLLGVIDRVVEAGQQRGGRRAEVRQICLRGGHVSLLRVPS
ncbi:hypothetical protein D3C87_1730040 [compost metagenome]